jgi:hypothetical protein
MAADIPSFTNSAALAKGEARQAKAPPEAPKAEAPKAPPRNMFSATMKKLDVFGLPGSDPRKPIPGHHLFWFDDVENYVTMAQASGWRFVTKNEVAMNDAATSPGNTALDDKVRAIVGWSGNQPTYAYLMAMPDELYLHHHEGPDSIEQMVHVKQEEQLAMGTYRMSPDDGRYTASNLPQGVAGSNLPSIKMGRYYKPPKT